MSYDCACWTDQGPPRRRHACLWCDFRARRKGARAKWMRGWERGKVQGPPRYVELLGHASWNGLELPAPEPPGFLTEEGQA